MQTEFQANLFDASKRLPHSFAFWTSSSRAWRRYICSIGGSSSAAEAFTEAEEALNLRRIGRGDHLQPRGRSGVPQQPPIAPKSGERFLRCAARVLPKKRAMSKFETAQRSSCGSAGMSSQSSALGVQRPRQYECRRRIRQRTTRMGIGARSPCARIQAMASAPLSGSGRIKSQKTRSKSRIAPSNERARLRRTSRGADFV